MAWLHSSYLAAYQFWAHLASTDKSTERMFLPLKGLHMQSTTMDLANSADSLGPSKITSSWTCFHKSSPFRYAIIWFEPGYVRSMCLVLTCRSSFQPSSFKRSFVVISSIAHIATSAALPCSNEGLKSRKWKTVKEKMMGANRPEQECWLLLVRYGSFGHVNGTQGTYEPFPTKSAHTHFV